MSRELREGCFGLVAIQISFIRKGTTLDNRTDVLQKCPVSLGRDALDWSQYKFRSYEKAQP
jgi:hypothetical protein